MIIGRELMVNLCLKFKFKCQVLQWDGATVHMKELSGLIGQSGLNKGNMHEVVCRLQKQISHEKILKNG